MCVELVSPPIYEKMWTFSNASDFQISVAIGLGILNLLGCFFVQFMINEQLEMGAELGILIPFNYYILPLLRIYAILYLCIPVLRYLFILYKNKTIATKNAERKQKAVTLLQNLLSVQNKLKIVQNKHIIQ